MNLSQADATIATFISTRWTSTPIVWENVEPREFSQAGQPLIPFGTADYIAVRTIGRGSTTLTIPAVCTRGTGQLFIASCVKAGTGTRTARARLDAFIGMLENATLRGGPGEGTVRFGNYTGPVGYSSANGWYVEEAGFLFTFERRSEI